jgi:glycolate oxidase FAD binding subunit
MTDVLKPRDAKDVEDAVRWALAGSKTLEVMGGGSKRPIGRPSQSDLTLDLSGLAGVTLYEPNELILSAKAGTSLADIEALTAAHSQEVAFEPIDYAALLGGRAAASTIGGALAANVSGPRRIKAGAARDHFLGVGAVSGRGDAFKSGGRVVKNVTGYDLCKLLGGSWGTLAVMTDVTIKVMPRAETEETMLVLGLDPARAVAAMTEVMGSACDVSGAAHLPRLLASRMDGEAASAGASITALRLEGVGPSVTHRMAGLALMMKPYGSSAILKTDHSQAFWRSVRDVQPLAAARGDGRVLWRVSTAPAAGAKVAGAIAAGGDAEVMFDWAGGLLWVALPPADDAGAARIREAVRMHGGHATLIRAPAATRAAVDAFEPLDPPLAALTKRVKNSFDPRGVLNPGRMYAGI